MLSMYIITLVTSIRHYTMHTISYEYGMTLLSIYLLNQIGLMLAKNRENIRQKSYSSNTDGSIR